VTILCASALGLTILTSDTGIIALYILSTNCKVWTCRVEAVGAAEAVVLIS